MLHTVFNRPTSRLKLFRGSVIVDIAASGDAWGEKYGHDGPIPPGHYVLTGWETWGTGIASEGFGQIAVADLDDATKGHLLAAGLASVSGDELVIGGISLPRGGLAKWDRKAIFIHGGGSNLGDHALDPMQELCKTEGCTRVHNQDFTALVAELIADNPANAPNPPKNGSGGFPATVVFSVLGDSPAASC